LFPGPVWAQIDVERQSDAVYVTAKDASVSKALAALSAQRRLTYTFDPGLDGPLEGDYSGTLQQVLKRVLDGYDYVIEISDDGIELKVIGRSDPTSRPPLPATARLQR
jgi:hypothetical protein